MAKMDNIELHGILAAAKNDALSADRASKLSADRARAMRYYQGDISQDVPSEDGKSAAISNDVSDTVDGMMPALLEIFAGGDEVIKFEPTGPEDVQAAEQETDYVNHVFMQKNPGFLILHNMIKDALLSKAGVVKVVWEEDERQSEEQYFDLDDTQYQFLTQDPDIVVIEHTEKDLPGDQDIENADRGMPQVPVSLTGLTQ